ncbi:MAG: hypothetical protein AAB551_01820 [Patescibacteria group bacterium]
MRIRTPSDGDGTHPRISVEDGLTILRRASEKQRKAQVNRSIRTWVGLFAAAALGAVSLALWIKKDQEVLDQTVIMNSLKERGIIDDMCKRCEGAVGGILGNFKDIKERKDKVLEVLGQETERAIIECRILGEEPKATLAFHQKSEGIWKEIKEIDICSAKTAANKR